MLFDSQVEVTKDADICTHVLDFRHRRNSLAFSLNKFANLKMFEISKGKDSRRWESRRYERRW